MLVHVTQLSVAGCVQTARSVATISVNSLASTPSHILYNTRIAPVDSVHWARAREAVHVWGGKLQHERCGRTLTL